MKIDRYQYNINFDKKNETVSGEGEFHKDYLDDYKKENDNKVTHLTPDDFIELESKDPVAHKALSEEINRQIELQQEQNEIDEMEKSVEAREKDEEQRKIELRESIFKVISENEVSNTAKEDEVNSVVDERNDNDNTEEYKRYAELARQKKEEEIKKREKELDKNIKKTKSKKRWWKKGGDSIEDIIDKNNQR